MKKRASILFGACLMFIFMPRSEAQISVQYDSAGNLVTQSNVVAIAPPAFQELAPLYIGADTNGLLEITAPMTGVGPFTYQWLFNGVAITGATNGSFLLTNATASNLGEYQLVAANSAGAVTSAPVNVSYLDPDGSGLPVAWELAYFGVTGVDPNADPDGDGVSNFLEYLDGTDPTNPHSVRPRLNIPTSIPGGTVSVVPLKPEYQLGDVVQVTAVPGAGFFQGWSGSNAAPVGGSFTNLDASLTLVMNSTIWLTPQFPGPVVVWAQGYDPGYVVDPESVVPVGLSNVVAISAGSLFGLALHDNATVVAWGDNTLGQLNVPSGLTNVVAIAAEDYSSLALESNGTVIAWGDNNVGQTNVPSGLSNVVAIAGGGVFGLALENNGTVVGWGDNTYGESTTPAGLSNVVAIAAGFDHSLALTGNGMVSAWGENSYGETNVPAGMTNVVAIAAGNYFSLALAGNGMVTAWGYNINGQTNVPAGLSNVVAIAAGETFCLALQGNGTLVAWGDNTYGETNVPAGLSNVVAIAGGGYLSLALLNDGSPFFIRQPVGIVAYSGGTAVLSAAIGGVPPLSYQWQLNGTNVAGATNATLTLTGLETNNADVFRVVVSNLLGTTTSASATLTANNAAPIILLPLANQAVLAGATAVFSVAATGSQPLHYQWQLNGTNIAGATQATLIVAAVTTASAGSYRVAVSNAFGASLSSAAILTQLSSLVVGWGDNSFGEIDVPAGLTNVVAIAGGYGFSLALQGNGTVAAWGYNGDGETNVPAGLSNAVAIAAGLSHCLALESDGTVAAWGNNGYGETTLPAGLSNVVAIAGGEYFSLAL
jgi:alpha-tubulin suppressor-like RCC1 family protein